MTFPSRALRDQSVLLVLLLAALVVFPRSILIAHAHSESIDDEYHLVRGVRFLMGTLSRTPLNDPTLGETILALPLWICGAQPNKDLKFGLVLHGQRVSAEALLMSVALLKSALFVPFVGFVFAWVRKLYNARAGWAAAVLMLIEPTITAHIVPAALDVIGFEAIVIASWLWWRYFDQPSWKRVTIAAAASGAAMLIKHTAIVMPFVALGYALLFCVYRRARDESISRWLATRWKHAIAAAAIALVSLAILSGGFARLSRPESVKEGTLAAALYDVPWPAGRYMRSLQTAMQHGEAGHPSWFMGHRNDDGSPAYYPVVALYKVPIPLLVFIAIGAASFAIVRPRFEEWALTVPMLLLAALITSGGINIGFRHAIPVVGLALMLSTRLLLIDRRWLFATAIVLLSLATIDVARWFPNFISYINWPRQRVWMQVNDSNLDWAQGLKQIAAWIDANKDRKPYQGRPIFVRAFGLTYSSNLEHYIGSRAINVPRNGPVPEHGILIISPVYVVGMFEKPGLYEFLKDRDPIATIGGGADLVFDLDRIDRSHATTSRPVRPMAAASQPDER